MKNKDQRRKAESRWHPLTKWTLRTPSPAARTYWCTHSRSRSRCTPTSEAQRTSQASRAAGRFLAHEMVDPLTCEGVAPTSTSPSTRITAPFVCSAHAVPAFTSVSNYTTWGGALSLCGQDISQISTAFRQQGITLTIRDNFSIDIRPLIATRSHTKLRPSLIGAVLLPPICRFRANFRLHRFVTLVGCRFVFARVKGKWKHNWSRHYFCSTFLAIVKERMTRLCGNQT